MNKEEISKVASSQFVPGFVQATDHSSLGEFMVARIKTIGKLNMKPTESTQRLMEMLHMLYFPLVKRA